MGTIVPATAGWWLDEYDGPRFWKFVDLQGGLDHQNDPLARASGQCWSWNGMTDSGYGLFRLGGKMVPAHRISFLDGSRDSRIPKGFVLDHLCRNKACVNPKHLEAVLHTVNVDRGLRGRASHPNCPHGHPYDESNTKWVSRNGNPVRYCRVCLADSKRRTYARRRARLAG